MPQTNKHRHIPMSSRYSGDLANRLMTFGRMNLAMRINATRRISASTIIKEVPPTPPVPVIDIIIRQIMTIKSCTISTQLVSLPYKVSISRLSVSNLMMIIVLLNATAPATYSDSITSKPRNIAIIYQSSHVRITCIPATITATFPYSLIVVKFKSNPTIKSKRAIPRLENSSIKDISPCN